MDCARSTGGAPNQPADHMSTPSFRGGSSPLAPLRAGQGPPASAPSAPLPLESLYRPGRRLKEEKAVSFSSRPIALGLLHDGFIDHGSIMTCSTVWTHCLMVYCFMVYCFMASPWLFIP